MSVLTVPRSIAISFLKNFSMNFTTFLLQEWKANRKRAICPSSGNSYARTKDQFTGGGCLGSMKVLLRLCFQTRTTSVRDKCEVVLLQRIQVDRKSTRLNSSHIPF